MTFIVTLIALLIERFFDWSHLRQWEWLHTYTLVLRRKCTSFSPFGVLVLVVVIPVLIVLLIQYLIYGLLYGFINLIFQLLVLLYCLGPQNLWADEFACIDALTHGDEHVAADKLKTSFGITDVSYRQSLHRHLLYTVFVEGNSRVFAVIFWYVVLGPAGAVLYRITNLSSAEPESADNSPEFAQAARLMGNILDWLPVRVLGFLFALSGHFVHVFDCWRKKVFLGPSTNESLLVECGDAALGIDPQDNIPEDGCAEKSAIGLLDRSLIILLVIIAAKVLII